MPNTFLTTSQPKLARPEWLIEKQKLAQQYADLPPIELKLLDSIIEEHLGQIWFWPEKYARLLLSKHLTYNDRYTLTTFLLANRLPPIFLAEWYLKRKMLRDESARKHVAGIIKMHRTGELEKRGFLCYVMGATDKNGDELVVKTQTVPTPSFCIDEMGEPRISTDPLVADWVGAEEMLNSGTVSIFSPIA